MSIDENTNEPGSTQSEGKPAEHAAEAIGASVDTAKNAANNLISSVLELKESNPKVFFGGVGAVALVLILIFSLGGGSNAKLVPHQAKPIVIGQTYQLKGANTYDPHATVRLVSVPGSMAAYDDTEVDDREGGCKHVQEGTPVKVIQSQDAYGKKDVFVEVEMTAGDCQGKRGWALAINLQ
jgi:hypothetical protein